MEKPKWNAHLFDEHSDLYEMLFVPNAEQTADEVKLLIQATGVCKGAHLLDACCGSGRHLVSLAQQGFFVTGVDISRVSLNSAISRVREYGIEDKTTFIEAAIEELNSANVARHSYDVVYQMYSSFGYDIEEDSHTKMLENMSKYTRPGGRLFLDLSNKDFVLGRFSPSSKYKKNGYDVDVTRKFDVDSQRISSHTVVSGREGTFGLDVAMRLYSIREIEPKIASVGYRVDHVYGSFDGSPFNINNPKESPRMIFVATKL